MKTQTSSHRRPTISVVTLLIALTTSPTNHFATCFSLQPITASTRTHKPIQTSLHLSCNDDSKPLLSTLTALSILTLPLASSSVANAYEENDYASETVTNVVSALKSNAGDVEGTFATLEEVAKIITEGKGVGGSLSYG